MTGEVALAAARSRRAFGEAVPKGLSSLALKSVALVLMVIEHFGLYFGEWLPPHTMALLEYPGRLVAPVFIFVMLESMRHTRSRRRYLLRLWLAAVLMFCGNLAVSAAVKPFSQADPFFPEGHNIFLMLAVAASAIACWDAARARSGTRRLGWATGALALSAAMIWTEGGLQLLPVLYVFYWFNDRRRVMLGVFSAYSAALFAYGWFTNPEHFWILENQWAQVVAVPLLARYNGQPGRAGFKWVFYGAYPAHIWFFYVVSNLLPR